MRSGTFAAVVLLASLSAFSATAGDVANGETLFNVSCAFCHRLTSRSAGEIRVEEDRQAELRQGLVNRPRISTEPPRPEVTVRDLPGRGPHLADLFRRPPGAVESFRYNVVHEIEGPVWTAADLDAWIAVHAGMDDETERADLIAYLEKATAR
jgi:cytochrome c2